MAEHEMEINSSVMITTEQEKAHKKYIIYRIESNRYRPENLICFSSVFYE